MLVQGPRGFGGHRLLSLNDIYFWKLQIPYYQDMGMKLVKAVQFFLYYVIMVISPLFGLIYISGQNVRYGDIFIDKNVITSQFMRSSSPSIFYINNDVFSVSRSF